MKTITVINAEGATETGSNPDKRLCMFEIEGPEEMDASDGYHTFDELYEHRHVLFIALCNAMSRIGEEWGSEGREVWKAKEHADGSMYESWFVLGIGKEKHQQITYHLPIKYWDEAPGSVLDQAPEWDGHTSDDVIGRLGLL